MAGVPARHLQEPHGDGGGANDSGVAMSHSGGAGGAQNHGDGSGGVQHHCDDDPSSFHPDIEGLTRILESRRKRKRVKDGMGFDIKRVLMHAESKQFCCLCKLELFPVAATSCGKYKKHCKNTGTCKVFRELMELKIDMGRLQQEANKITAKMKHKEEELQRAKAVVTAKSSSWEFNYTLAELGQGKKGGGTREHQQHRFDVLDRIRSVAELSPDQKRIWVIFRTAWDEKMAHLHQEDWGFRFNEIAYALMWDLNNQKTNALSLSMEGELKRALGEPTLGDCTLCN